MTADYLCEFVDDDQFDGGPHIGGILIKYKSFVDSSFLLLTRMQNFCPEAFFCLILVFLFVCQQLQPCQAR